MRARHGAGRRVGDRRYQKEKEKESATSVHYVGKEQELGKVPSVVSQFRPPTNILLGS